MDITHSDFEGSKLEVGDLVLTNDIDKYGGWLRRGKIVKLCDQSVRVELSVVCRHTGATSSRVITRYGCAVALIQKGSE